MRETSRGGALVSAVVAVLERQQNETNAHKSDLFKSKFEKSAIKECPNRSNPQQSSISTTATNGDKAEPNGAEKDWSSSKENGNGNEHDENGKTGAFIKECIYKQDVSLFGHNRHLHPSLFVHQKDPKLLKNTSYVIVKEHEEPSGAEKPLADTASRFPKRPPTSASATKNKPHCTQTPQEANSNRQCAGSPNQTRASTETLAETHLRETADRSFETAIEHFDRTAQDVQNYVLKKNEVVLRKKPFELEGDRGEEAEKERSSSTTDYTSNVSDEFDSSSTNTNSSSSSSDDDSSSSGSNRVREGLETITEEERTVGSSFKSTVGEANFLDGTINCALSTARTRTRLLAISNVV